MNTMWAIIGFGVAGAVVALIALWYRHNPPVDLGAVSHQWIAEHRLGSGPDSRR